jgi:hypothetical protein
MALLYIAVAVAIVALLVHLMSSASYATEVRRGGNENLDHGPDGHYDADY